MTGLQLFPEDLCEIFYASISSLRRVFEIGATVMLRRLSMLKLMDLLVDFLNASMKGRTAKKCFY